MRSRGAATKVSTSSVRGRELEALLLGVSAVGAGRSDVRLREAVLRHGVFAAVEARLGDPAASTLSDGCAGRFGGRG